MAVHFLTSGDWMVLEAVQTDWMVLEAVQT